MVLTLAALTLYYVWFMDRMEGPVVWRRVRSLIYEQDFLRSLGGEVKTVPNEFLDTRMAKRTMTLFYVRAFGLLFFKDKL